MFRTALFKNIPSTRDLFYNPKAYLRAPYWQQPITQQTLTQFLNDINYFDEATSKLDIGLKEDGSNIVDLISIRNSQQQLANDRIEKAKLNLSEMLSKSDDSSNLVNRAIETLSQEVQIPELDFDDCDLNVEDITRLAEYYGIYRDLFGTYKPNRGDIYFTTEQAERMAKVVPNYWITDQPYARIKRQPPKQESLLYFNPLIRISAKFINERDDDTLFAHQSYHGNLIPACDGSKRPSIILDGRLLCQSKQSDQSTVLDKNENWENGSIRLANFDDNFKGYLTVALINLDSVHQNSGLLHWMVTNIKPAGHDSSIGQEVCDYLPVHGIRGFGYSRYVFLVIGHENQLPIEKIQIKEFSMNFRKFDTLHFLEMHKEANVVPIGLSWFQTSWDKSSNSIFHNYFKTQAPVYEHVLTQAIKHEDEAYPGRIPFNIYLDHRRQKKDINEQVLLERLKKLDPFDYKDQYVAPKVPETVFVPKKLPPSWMHVVDFKKANKIGYWRGLRPASAMLPLDNNADLDNPIRPLESAQRRPLDEPNQYVGKYKKKSLRDCPSSKPSNEHQTVFIQNDHEMYIDEVKQIVESMKEEVAIKKEKRKNIQD